MIMFSRRSNLSATAPATGPSTSAGSSEVSQTPLTAYAPPLVPPIWAARADSASRLSQSPRLASVSATHSRRNGVIDSTLVPWSAKGDLKFTAPGYRSERETAADSVKLSWVQDQNLGRERGESSSQPSGRLSKPGLRSSSTVLVILGRGLLR